MSTARLRLLEIDQHYDASSLHITTLGEFSVKVDGRKISPKEWGRDKTVQLFQYLITSRTRRSLHKEQIIDRLWEDNEGDRDFKVALHGINKTLEPTRPPRTEPKYIQRQGISYQLNQESIWIDSQIVENYIILANEVSTSDTTIAIAAYRKALSLHHGTYLPNRSFEDWSSEERERLQVLILGAYLSLGELVLEDQPIETIRLTQKVISDDNTWEDAYQLQMRAYLKKGNRPAAIKTYHKCVKILDQEFGLDPLPQTQDIFDSIV